MDKIDDYISFVKEQVSVQDKLANKYDDQPYRKGLHMKTGAKMADLLRFLEENKKLNLGNYSGSNRSASAQKRIQLTLEDIEGLPDELIKELNISETDKQELLIEHIIAQSGGILSLDKILVELYRRTKEIHKRSTLISRLFRMASRGIIYNVPGKKGVYSTYELSEQDVKRLFGQVDGEQEREVTANPVAALVKNP